MAKTLQHRRDTTTNLASVSGAIGEFFMDTTKNTLVVMDGSTNGGYPLALESSLTSKQDTLVSGTTIKTVNGTSLLGSGNITISSSSADFSAVAEDVLPSLNAVYDLGSSTEQWYDLFVSNSVTIDGGSLTGNATGLVTDTLLIGDLLVTTNTITPDASTALQYNGDQGIVDILGNLDVSTGDWLLPAVVETVGETVPLTTGTEGMVRYNKDETALQVYTDAWKNVRVDVPEKVLFTEDEKDGNGNLYALPGKTYVADGGINFYWPTAWTADPIGTKGEYYKVLNASVDNSVVYGNIYKPSNIGNHTIVSTDKILYVVNDGAYGLVFTD